MKHYIETAHLILRDWKEEDIPPFTAMNASERVMEYFPKKLSPEESLNFYHQIVSEIKTSGFGLYAIEEKKSHAFIGFTGLHRIAFNTDFTPGIEISWRLTEQFWNKGYATEAASACLEYAKTMLNMREIYAFTSLLNKRSERIMQKTGMQKIKEFRHPLLTPEHPLSKHVLYKKSSDET